MNLDAITTPTLLLDEEKCRRNINRMAEKAKEHELKFKPHFKTHQSAEIGNWFREEGVKAITVSSLKMAEYFAANGWNDITVALPVNIRAINQINDLSSKIKLSLLINDMRSLKFLNKRLACQVNLYLEIDTGDQRSGIDPSNIELISQLTDYIISSEKMLFSGFYSHPGHSYACKGTNEVRSLHQNVLHKVQKLKSLFKLNTNSYSVCIGDTPCCSLAKDFNDIDEISPGNFVFYDLMQTQIESCTLKDIAVALACPVVAKYKDRHEIIIHGGAIHFSKEFLTLDGVKQFGAPVILNNDGWNKGVKNSYLKSLSQEHGIIKCSKDLFETISTGDLIGILPIHSCLTANLMSSFITTSGNEINQW